MLKLPHNRHLSQDALTVLQIVKDVLESLDCNFLPRAASSSQSYLPVAAYAYNLFTLVVVANIPILEQVLFEEIEVTSPTATISPLEFLRSRWTSSLVPNFLFLSLAFNLRLRFCPLRHFMSILILNFLSLNHLSGFDLFYYIVLFIIILRFTL